MLNAYLVSEIRFGQIKTSNSKDVGRYAEIRPMSSVPLPNLGSIASFHTREGGKVSGLLEKGENGWMVVDRSPPQTHVPKKTKK